MAERSHCIRTARLDLIASTALHLRVELEDPRRLGGLLGATVPASWPPGLYDQDAMRFFLEQALKGGAEAIGWYGWYAVRRPEGAEKALLVAAVGYLGPPSADGTVEIGYSVVPEVRGQGYATEAATAMTERALALPSVLRVVAEAHESNRASQKVLARCGFQRVGPGREPGYFRFAYAGAPRREEDGGG